LFNIFRIPTPSGILMLVASRTSARPTATAFGTRQLELVRGRARGLRSLGTGAFAASFGALFHELPPLGCVARHIDLVATGLAHASEALRRAVAVDLYDEQLIGAWHLIRGSIAEMRTGEGKTFSVASAAFVLALSRRPVHVMTANLYLAERDRELIAPAARLLGVSVRSLPAFPEAEGKARAYAADILYGTSTEIGFDYLRYDLARNGTGRRPLGSQLLDRMRDTASDATGPFHLDHAIGLVDEADQVLLDDAAVPLILADRDAPSADELFWVRRADEMVAGWQLDREFRLDSAGETPTLVDPIPFEDDPSGTRARPWDEYLRRALEARHLLARDRDYLVDRNEVVLLDRNTGRRLPGHRWQRGLHEAVETREGLPSCGDSRTLASITRPRLMRLYHHLAGTTGTAATASREFQDLYRLPVAVVEPHFPDRRHTLPGRAFVDRESRLRAVALDAKQRAIAGQPVLIGTRTIADGELLARVLTAEGLATELLTGKHDADEAGVVSRAGLSGAVTITTGLAGRGTDIPVAEESLAAGGLHVIVAERQHSSRVDRQLVGRCARQGQPGSTQVYASADDWLVRRFSPRVGEWMRKQPSDGGEIASSCDEFLTEAQRRSEVWSAEQRRLLLAADVARENLCRDLKTDSPPFRHTG
jgi:preprotein translocase subunit SecA